MPHPWESEETYSHEVYEHNGFYKCKRCEKMATAERKLMKTPCNP